MKKSFLLLIIIISVLIYITPYTYAQIENQIEISAEVYGIPEVIVPSTGGSGSRILMIENVRVDSYHDSGIIKFTTTQPTQVKIFWGKTKDYEMGSVSGIFYKTDYSVKITGLKEDTKYFFRIEAVNISGIMISAESSFQSQKNYNFLQLANVTHFQAIPKENSIALLWNIPQNKDISEVRIVKSDKFYPRDINDGEIIFEGNKEEYIDESVLTDKVYYYAIFSKDIKGNYSSGVLAQAKILKLGEILIPATSTDPFINIGVLENADPIIRSLTFSDFDFIQDNRKIENSDSVIAVDGLKNLTVLLNYNKVPEILKTIAITLTDPYDRTKVFTFLLRVNKEKTQYEATIAPLGKSGKYGVNIIVLDYKNQGLKRINGMMNALIWQDNEMFFKNCGVFNEYGECVDMSVRNKMILFLIILLLLLIAILGFIFRRRNNKEESK